LAVLPRLPCLPCRAYIGGEGGAECRTLGAGPSALTASCSFLAVSLPTDAEDWITTKRRHLYGNPQGNIGGRLPGLPYDNCDPRCRISSGPNVILLSVGEIVYRWRTIECRNDRRSNVFT
jgi:hypothetical protein